MKRYIINIIDKFPKEIPVISQLDVESINVENIKEIKIKFNQEVLYNEEIFEISNYNVFAENRIKEIKESIYLKTERL